MTNLADKIRGCFVLGACGDALGAPLEGIRKLSDIRAQFGAAGLREIVAYDNPFEKGVNYPAGRLTDDTTMAMTTAAATALALRATSPDDTGFIGTLRRYLWQGFLNWGQHQDESATLARKIDPAIAWDAAVQPFWFHCGAGRGTIAAMMQDNYGTVAQPQHYDHIVRGKRTRTPNNGCGGMMRVAAIGFLPVSPVQLFTLAAESAAMTNGHPEAFCGAGATALMIHFAARGFTPQDITLETQKVLATLSHTPVYAAGIATVQNTISHARDKALQTPRSFDAIDALPQELGYKNPFVSMPVLAQVVYALETVATAGDIENALVLCANHSGDSDSTAAILGNILGARYGEKAAPKKWADILLQKKSLIDMANIYAQDIARHIKPPDRQHTPKPR